jgi:hypothetical protein
MKILILLGHDFQIVIEPKLKTLALVDWVWRYPWEVGRIKYRPDPAQNFCGRKFKAPARVFGLSAGFDRLRGGARREKPFQLAELALERLRETEGFWLAR